MLLSEIPVIQWKKIVETGDGWEKEREKECEDRWKEWIGCLNFFILFFGTLTRFYKEITDLSIR